MILNHVWGILTRPNDEWLKIRDEQCTIGRCYALHVMILAAIPAIAGYIGTSMVGWRIGSGEPVMLAADNALVIAIVFYLAMIVGVYMMGLMVYWMGKTYETESVLSQCVLLAAYVVTPLFLVGVTAIYPILWFIMLAGLPATAFSVYLLYTGLPIMMNVSKEQGFVFSSAVLGVALVGLVSLLIVMVLLWGFGFEPQFVN